MQFYIEFTQNPIVIAICFLLLLIAVVFYVRRYVSRDKAARKLKSLEQDLALIDENLATVISNKKKETEALDNLLKGRF